MNTIYKVIFNKSLGIFIATSELSKANRKTQTCRKLIKSGLISSSILISPAILAATSTDYIDINTSNTATTSALGANSIAIGQGANIANTLSQKAIAIGLNASVNPYNYSTTLSNRRKGEAAGLSSVAIGDTATVNGSYAVALGYNTNATGAGSVALGNAAKNYANSYYNGSASNGGAIAIGQQSYTVSQNSIAMGNSASATGWKSIAIGNNAKTLDITNTASSDLSQNIKDSIKNTVDTLRLQNSPLNTSITFVEQSIADQAGSSIAIGDESRSIGWGSTALGTKAYALNDRTTSLGDDSKALGHASSSLGTGAYTFGTYSAAVGTRSEALGNKAIAFGTATSASGEGSIAQGYGAAASGINAIAIGTATTASRAWYTTQGGTRFNPAEHSVWNASGDYSIALGSDAVASEEYSTAIGKSATSTHKRSVALGDLSTSEEAIDTDSGTVNGITYGGFAGKTSIGTVSMGNSSTNETRQVKNVSAGEISSTSTDAINGSQLYVITKALASNSNSGFNLTTSKSAGEVSGTSVTKIGSSETVTIDAGKNISLTQTNSTISVATKDEVDFNKVTVGPVTIDNTSGINAGDTKITGVSDGDISPTSKDAINGSQLYALQQQIINGAVNDTSASISSGSDTLTVTKGDTTTEGNTKVTNYAVDLSQTTKDNIQKGVDAKDIVDNKGLTFSGDSGSTDVQKLGSTVEVKGDENITTKASGKTVSVSLNKNLKVDSVTMGDTTVNNNGITINNGAAGNQVSLTKNGLNNGGNRITNVAEGVDGTDAVNVNQLRKSEQNINNKINHVDNKINRIDKDLRAGIAGATAISFLQRPNEAGKSMVSAAAGGYRGESAVAVGYARNSDNNKVSIKLGVGVNSRSDVAYGGSVGFQW